MNWNKAPIKCEGQQITQYEPSKEKVETTYVERRVPEHLEKRAHKLIDQFLRDHGYDPMEI
jgi:hypothetical protein